MFRFELHPQHLNAFKAALVSAVHSQGSATREDLIGGAFQLLEECLEDLVNSGEVRLEASESQESHLDKFRVA